MKKIFLNSLIFLFSLLITLVLCELFLKKFYTQNSCNPHDVQPFIDSRGFSLLYSFYPPNQSILHCNRDFLYTYHIDSNGLRSTSPHENEVLSVGDSFTFGFGVEDYQSYSSLIGSYNAGLWGNTFDSQYKSFVRNVAIFKPKTVVWTIYPPHLISMTESNWSSNCPGDTVIQLPKLLISFSYLFNNSFFSFIANLELYKFFLKAFDLFSITFNNDSIFINKNCYQTKEIILYDKNLSSTSYSNKIFNPKISDELNDSFSKFSNIFKNVAQIAKSENIRLVFVLIPSKFYLASSKSDFIPPNYEGLNFDRNFTKNKIKDILIDVGISKSEIIDISDIVELKDNEWRKYYFKHDAHLNPLGNELVADYILKKLTSN